MQNDRLKRSIKILTGYYGILQSLHLLSLARAGWLILRSGRVPFPAPPPPGGWPADSIPFLLGMGLTDVFAIGLGLVFAYRFFFKRKIALHVGLISLSVALSSGLVYLIGTLPSGAWGAHLPAYLFVILLFSPVIPLWFLLLKSTSRSEIRDVQLN